MHRDRNFNRQHQGIIIMNTHRRILTIHKLNILFVVRYQDPLISKSSDYQTSRSSCPQILRFSDSQNPQILRSWNPEILRFWGAEILRYSDPQIFKSKLSYNHHKIIFPKIFQIPNNFKNSMNFTKDWPDTFMENRPKREDSYLAGTEFHIRNIVQDCFIHYLDFQKGPFINYVTKFFNFFAPIFHMVEVV